MGKIVTKEERDLVAQLRKVLKSQGVDVTKISDEQLMESINEGKRQMLERAAVLIVAFAHNSGERQFNVFVENMNYGRMITKVRVNPKNIEAFVMECVEGVSASYWSDIDQLSGPELLSLGDRVELLLKSLDDEQESA